MTHNLVRAGLASALALSVAACGGGGSDGAPQATPIASPFAKYVGSWVSACQFHHHEVYTLSTNANATVLTFSDKSEYFSNDDCSGAVVATGVYSAPIATLSYQTTEPNASVALQSGEKVSNAVDKGTGQGSNAAVSFSGSGVSATTVSGKPGWHIVYPGGSTDLVVQTVQGATPGGVMLRNGQLYILVAQANTSTGFDASAPLSKSP